MAANLRLLDTLASGDRDEPHGTSFGRLLKKSTPGYVQT